MTRSLEQKLFVLSRLGEILVRNVVPICEKDQRGYTCGHGTGLLVTYKSQNFLVTAAHVLDPLREGRRLYFPCSAQGERNIQGPALCTKAPDPADCNSDKIDIGVVKLDGEWQPPYPEVNKVALPFDCLTPGAVPRTGKQYFVTGFPATRVRAHIRNQQVETRPYGNWCSSINDDEYQTKGLRPLQNFALSFDVKNVQADDGPTQSFPEPQGLSGSPIWLLYDEHGENDPTTNQVVGILIEHRRADKLLVGTDIKFAIELIRQLS